jgi:phosphoglycolate phosphatase
MLEHLGVRDLFDVVIGADKVKEVKPSPDMLYSILYSSGYDKEKDSVWMIGDSAKDMVSAKNAGVKSIFVTWGFSQKDVKYQPIETPKEVLKQILSL